MGSCFYAMNRALLFKWVWQFKTQQDALWVRVVKAIHGLHGSLDRIPPSTRSSRWIECVKSMNQLNKNCVEVDLMSLVKKTWVMVIKPCFGWIVGWMVGC